MSRYSTLCYIKWFTSKFGLKGGLIAGLEFGSVFVDKIELKDEVLISTL